MKDMNNYKKPYVIAEIGCNHKGEMEIAKELIKIAKIGINQDKTKTITINENKTSNDRLIILIIGNIIFSKC